MAGRPKDPLRAFRMKPHAANGYLYAATSCSSTGSEGNGKHSTKYIHWGTLVDGRIFKPNLKFIMSSRELRDSFIFPDNWDISAAEHLNDQVPHNLTAESDNSTIDDSSIDGKQEATSHNNGSEASGEFEIPSAVSAMCAGSESSEAMAAKIRLPYRDLLYGNVWFLLQIAEAKHVIEDLMITFEYKESVVNDILTMAIFPYITRKNFDRLAHSQRIYHYPSTNVLTPPYITTFTQMITPQNRMDFCRLRIMRQPKGAYFACDSSTRSAWGTCIAEIRFGRNKDNKEMNCTLEVVVYSLTTHEPVYYRMFPGNEPDARTLHTINADLRRLGITNFTTIFDRGYESKDNFDNFFRSDMPFIACAKVAQEPVIDCLLNIKYDGNGMPTNMAYSQEYRLFYCQFMTRNRTYIDETGVSKTVDEEDFKCNVFLDPASRPFELIEVDSKIAAEHKILMEKLRSGELLEEQNTINKKCRFHIIEFDCNEKSKVISARILRDEVAIAREKAQCGFFSSVAYKTPGNALSMLEIYKTRDEQEKYYEQMKDQMDFHTQDASSEDGREGREFILFVGLILSSTVRNTWKSSVELRKEFKTSLSILDEMEDIRWIQYEDGEQHMTEFCGGQLLICKTFGLNAPSDCLPSTERKLQEQCSNGKKRGRKPKETPAPNKISVVPC